MKGFKWEDFEVNSHYVTTTPDEPSGTVVTREQPRNQVLQDKLWIGDFWTQRTLLCTSIKAVVSLGTSDSNYTTHPNVDYLRLDADDTERQDLSQYFQQSNTFIKQHLDNGNQVLVHSEAGESRSAAMCIAYLMKELELDFFQAYARVKEARPLILLNGGFARQLLRYEQELKKN